MIRPSRSTVLIFLAGLALVMGTRFAGDAAIAKVLAGCGIAVCVLALWRAHAAADEVARQFAFNAFALGFAAMAAWSWAGAPQSLGFPTWSIGFTAFLLAYAFQLVRAQ